MAYLKLYNEFMQQWNVRHGVLSSLGPAALVLIKLPCHTLHCCITSYYHIIMFLAKVVSSVREKIFALGHTNHSNAYFGPSGKSHISYRIRAQCLIDCYLRQHVQYTCWNIPTELGKRSSHRLQWQWIRKYSVIWKQVKIFQFYTVLQHDLPLF
jgi:hypothetical protein